MKGLDSDRDLFSNSAAQLSVVTKMSIKNANFSAPFWCVKKFMQVLVSLEKSYPQVGLIDLAPIQAIEIRYSVQFLVHTG